VKRGSPAAGNTFSAVPAINLLDTLKPDSYTLPS